MVPEPVTTKPERDRHWLQFRLRTLFIGMAVVAGVLTFYCPFRSWCVETYYPGYYVHSVNYSLHNGDTVEDIAKYFHRVSIPPTQDIETVLEIWKSRGWEIAEGDEILHFSVKKGHGRWCQFRDGRLINHDNTREQPRDLVRIMDLNNQPCPPWYLR